MATMGRPTTYTDDMPQRMLDFFLNWKEFEDYEEETASAGRVVKIKKRRPNMPPTLAAFARSINTHRGTLRDWAENHPDFSTAYKQCVEIQEQFLFKFGLAGEYNPAISKLMLSNHCNVNEKIVQEVEQKTVQINLAYKE